MRLFRWQQLPINRPLASTMPINASSICQGRCYVTVAGEVRKVVEVHGNNVAYVVRGKLAFPTWDKKKWHSVPRDWFATQVSREVPCDWQRE